MSKIVFPTSSAPGISPQQGGGRLVNCRAVKTEQGARAPLLWPRAAGLRENLSTITDHTGCRGLKLVGSTLLVVLGSRVYAVTESGGVLSATNLGALSGTDNVTFARNNAATPNIVVVCDAGTFNLFTGAAPTAFADGDLPSVISCCEADGYIVFVTASGQIWATDLNAVTVSSSSFEESELIGGALRPVWYRGELFIFGPNGVKVYEETGQLPFPFTSKKITIPVGLIGTHAVAGFEDGFTGQMGWVASDDTFRILDGYAPKIVSNDDVTRAISSASDRSAITVRSYMDGAYPILSVTSAGEWTWEYNIATGSWNERASYGREDWRGRCTVKAFDMWIAGDDLTGKLSKIDPDYKKEYDDALVWEMISGSNAEFPYPFNIGPAYFDFTAALGVASGTDPIESDPSVLISWSLDGGYSYGLPVQRQFGQQGIGGKTVSVSSVGLTKAKGVRFKLQVSDPVEPGFLGGDMPRVEKRAA